MTSEDIKLINTTIGIQLPNHYVSFMLQFPKELHDLLSPYDDVIGNCLQNNESVLIRLNTSLNCYNSSGFIKNKFAIGEDGCGNYYFIDLVQSQNEKIYFFDHESYDSNLTNIDWEEMVVANNLLEFKIELIKLLEELKSNASL
jgi:hypothetical protein